MAKITMYTWGYWGWGSVADKFVKSVDALETSRRFNPPLFVDIRLLRSVRAKLFNGKAFEELVGPSRYVWMCSLGNKEIATHGTGIVINKPEAAEELLDIALQAYKKKQRIIFFCACEVPGIVKDPLCHRVIVADLIKKAARKKKKTVQIIEWPGGEPKYIDMKVKEDDFKKISSGPKSITLGKKIDHTIYAGIPWGSIARIKSGDKQMEKMTGPAKFERDTWQLPVLKGPDDLEDLKDPLKGYVKRWRKSEGYEYI